jgi:hypothetical protein
MAPARYARHALAPLPSYHLAMTTALQLHAQTL